MNQQRYAGKVVFAGWLLFFLAAGFAWGQLNPLRGDVRYPNGKPAAYFQVLIAPISPPAFPQTQTQTDESGEFTFSGLSPGQYAIYPFDQSSAHPLRSDMFLSKNPDR